MGHRHMIDGAHAQIEIIKVRDWQDKSKDQTLALASFTWDCHTCWLEFTRIVMNISDTMYAEFDEAFDGVTQYVQFKTDREMQ
tara:strand:+ start:722 stop:970 length:249 start_codon:yes stop_codon:yes gene_type:complete